MQSRVHLFYMTVWRLFGVHAHHHPLEEEQRSDCQLVFVSASFVLSVFWRPEFWLFNFWPTEQPRSFGVSKSDHLFVLLWACESVRSVGLFGLISLPIVSSNVKISIQDFLKCVPPLVWVPGVPCSKATFSLWPVCLRERCFKARLHLGEFLYCLFTLRGWIKPRLTLSWWSPSNTCCH